jgi:hypothetical protein
LLLREQQELLLSHALPPLLEPAQIQQLRRVKQFMVYPDRLRHTFCCFAAYRPAHLLSLLLLLVLCMLLSLCVCLNPPVIEWAEVRVLGSIQAQAKGHASAPGRRTQLGDHGQGYRASAEPLSPQQPLSQVLYGVCWL